MLKKVLFSLIAVIFIFVGVLILTIGYFFTYPDKFFGVMHSVTDRVFQGQKYEENEEFFLAGIKSIRLSAHGMKLFVRTYPGSTLKVEISGKIPQFEKGPFILQILENNDLHLEFRDPLASSWFHINVNGEEFQQQSNADLKAQIFIPENFTEPITIQTHDGDVSLHLSKDHLYELDLQSASGKITNNFAQNVEPGITVNQVGRIKVQTEIGTITVEPQ